MKKLLLMFVALFVMGGGTIYADDTLDITDEGMFKKWSGEETVNGDGSVTLTFTDAWQGAGWSFTNDDYYLGPVDLTQYAEVAVVFKDNTAGSVYLYIQDNVEWTGESVCSSSDAEGKLVFYIADYTGDVVLTSISDFIIQTSAAGSVTIESITFMDEAVVDDEVINIANADKTAWPDDSTDNITVNDDGTVTLNFVTEGDGGLGWTNWWPTWDASKYDYIVLKYKDLSSDVEDAYIFLYVGNSSDGIDNIIDEDASGQIVVALADYPNFDFSSIGQIVVRASAPLSVTVESLYFTTSLGDEEGGDDELTFEYEGLYYEVLYEDVTDDEGNVVGTTPTDNVQIISPEDYQEGLGAYTITNLSIPATASNGTKTYNVTRLGTGAFANSAVADLVTIPGNIVSTGVGAFENCYGITRVVFEEGEDFNDENDSNGDGTGIMFGNCPNIDIVTVNRDIYCGSTTRLCAPFTYNTSITTIFIGENVTRVPAYMFRNTSNGALTTVTIYAETPIGWRYDPFSNKTGNKIPILYVHEDAIEAYEAAVGTDEVGYTDIFEQILPIEGVPEGITNIETETSAKVTGIYNLAGQRVNENAKGILIKDGKKVLVK